MQAQTKPRKYTYKDGTIRYKLNGLRHRLDGPAVIRADGTQEWWLNGKRYDFDDYCKKLNLTDEDIVFLKLKFNTCIVS